MLLGQMVSSIVCVQMNPSDVHVWEIIFRIIVLSFGDHSHPMLHFPKVGPLMMPVWAHSL